MTTAIANDYIKILRTFNLLDSTKDCK